MSNRSRQRPLPAAAPSRARPPARASSAPAPVEVEDDVFDLDALAREARDERLRFKAAGRIWELRTPEEVDWQANSRIPESNPSGNDLRPFMRLLLAEQYDEFARLTLSVTQITALIGQWQEWHAVEVPES
jgi:hypothetical protein